MFVLIMPTIESICEDYGLDYNDTNEEELLEQQGLEAYHIEVNDGESFEIPQGLIQDDLPSGLYQLDKDEITVKQIYQTDVF